MTQKEAIKFLSNTKVYVNGKSKEIQEKLFSLGFQWSYKGKQVICTDKPFIFVCNDMTMGYCDNMEYFMNQNTFREITADDILNIVIDKPKYRPFETADECWNEMLKHHPFGWLMNGKFKFRATIRCVAHNNNITLSNGSVFSFSETFDKYTFADGTPFGIKVEEE